MPFVFFYYIVNKNWYNVLWRKVKKQAKRIVNSKADADSSSEESMSLDTLGIIRLSNSTRNNLKDYIFSKENVAFSSLECDKVNSVIQEIDKYYQMVPSINATMILDCLYEYPLTPAVSSHDSILNQAEEIPNDASDRFWCENDVCVRYNRTGASERSENRPIHHICVCYDDHHTIYIPTKYISINKPDETLGENEDGLDIFAVDVKRAENDKEEQRKTKSYMEYKMITVTPAIPKNNNYSLGTGPVSFKNDDWHTTKFKKSEDESKAVEINQYSETTKHNTKWGNGVINEGQNFQEVLITDAKALAAKDGKMKVRNLDSLANFKLLVNIKTSSDKTGEETLEDSSTNFKFLYEITTGEESIEFEKAMAGIRSIHKLTKIKLYRSLIRNETVRMMISIDIVESETKYLFGLERSWIFFDLLDDGLFHCGPAGAIYDFVPNMAKSNDRQHVISFFELVHNMMNRLMTLLLGCPDSKRLQQMPEQNFISLMQSVIDSSLKTKIKGGKRLSSKGSTFVMVESEEFVRALGDEIPEDVLDRLRRGDEMVAHRFVDTRLERTQASERRENRPIHSIYFPSDCRLFIYIPTENGSYWHQLDMQRANRTSQHGK